MGFKRILLFVGIMFSFHLSSVSAYLDPGSGSMILQIIVGGAVAAGIMIKTQWLKIKSFLFKKNKENNF